MKNIITILFLACPMFFFGQTIFDFKAEQAPLGWIESGGTSENSGITSDGYELNWNACNTPKLKHSAANIDAETTPIFAITVKIKSNEIKTLRLVHFNAEDLEGENHVSEEFLYRTPGAVTFYFDLTHTQWKNYTDDNDHDYFEIGFQDSGKTNIMNKSEYGDLVIEKIEFLKVITDVNQEINIFHGEGNKSIVTCIDN